MKKEVLLYCENVGTDTVKVTVETDIPILEETEKILQSHAVAYAEKCEVQTGRIAVDGTVFFYVLCQNAEGEVKRYEEKKSFSEMINFQGAEQGMQVLNHIDVLKTDIRLLGNKINGKAEVGVSVEGCFLKEQEYVEALLSDGMEQKQNTLSFMRSCGMYQRRFEICEQAELSRDNPSVLEILRVDGKITPVSYKAINHKAVLQGDLDVVILYTDADTFQICTAAVSIPFTEIFEVEGLEEDWVFLYNMLSENIDFRVESDERGEARVIHLTCHARCDARMYVPQTATFVTDCYGIGKQLDTVRDDVTVFLNAGSMNGQIGIKGQIEIGEFPQIGQVYFVSASPKADSTSFEKGRCTVQGTVKISVYYITDEEETKLAVLTKEMPFCESFPCDGEATPVFYMRASGMSYTLNGDYVIDIRGNIEFYGLLLQKENLQIIRAVSIEEEMKNDSLASVTVCFAQNGESLWDIAKRYSTSVQAIADINEISETANPSGKRLIVPKYK